MCIRDRASTSRDRDIYLVTVPTGTTHVKFENTDKIIDYANGYNNRYVNAYRMTCLLYTSAGSPLALDNG